MREKFFKIIGNFKSKMKIIKKKKLYSKTIQFNRDASLRLM